MKNGMEVLKFGGSSLVSADAMKRVRDVLVARRGTQRIVVCSAMGGVTNALIQIGLKAAQGDAGYTDLLDALIERHRKTLDDLGMAADADVRAELNGKFDRLRSLCAGICLLEELSAKSMDQLVSFGERLAVPMVHAWLDEAGLITRRVDARDWIATDDQFGAAEVDRRGTPLHDAQEPQRSRWSCAWADARVDKPRLEPAATHCCGPIERACGRSIESTGQH